jgi:hypothetical protein
VSNPPAPPSISPLTLPPASTTNVSSLSAAPSRFSTPLNDTPPTFPVFGPSTVQVPSSAGPIRVSSSAPPSRDSMPENRVPPASPLPPPLKRHTILRSGPRTRSTPSPPAMVPLRPPAAMSTKRSSPAPPSRFSMPLNARSFTVPASRSVTVQVFGSSAAARKSSPSRRSRPAQRCPAASAKRSLAFPPTTFSIDQTSRRPRCPRPGRSRSRCCPRSVNGVSASAANEPLMFAIAPASLAWPARGHVTLPPRAA